MYIQYEYHHVVDPECAFEALSGIAQDDADGNVPHIARHGVVPEEVEESLVDNPLVFRTGDGRYLGYGKTGDGRPLFIVFVSKPDGIVRPLTARAMTDAEKRLYRRKRGKPR
jgi:uncharacterized protein